MGAQSTDEGACLPGFSVVDPRPLIVVRTHPGVLGLCMGQPAADPGVHPPEVSGVGAHSGFQVGLPDH